MLYIILCYVQLLSEGYAMGFHAPGNHIAQKPLIWQAEFLYQTLI